MKNYICIEVGHHNKISEEIRTNQKNGWVLHTYQAVCINPLTGEVRHYLLFGRE